MKTTSPLPSRSFVTAITVIAWITSSVGALVLVGLWLGVGFIVGAATPSVSPNEAFSFTAAGVALWLVRPDSAPRRRLWLAGGLAAVPVLVGSLTLTEYALGSDLGIDRLLLPALDGIDRNTMPGRPAFTTALTLVLIGAAFGVLATGRRRGPATAQLLAVLAALIALLALLGYAAGVPSFYGAITTVAPVGMSVVAAVLVILLGTGIVAARPGQGLMAILRSRGADGVAARWLLLVPVALPLVTGLLRLEGQRRGLYHPEVGGWLFSLANVTIFTLVIWYVAAALRRADSGRLWAEEEVRRLNADLERQVAARTAELREEEGLFRGAFDHSHVAMVITNLSNRFIRANAAFARLFGYTPEEVLGLGLADVTHPDHLADSLDRRQVLLTGSDGAFQMEKRYRHKDGQILWGLTNVALVRGPDGGPLMYVGQVQDITERKQAEAELERERTLLRTLIDALPDAIWTKDATGRFVVSNRAHVEMVQGGSEAEVAGRTGSDFHPPDLARGYDEDDARVLRHGEIIFNREELVRDPTGRERWHLVTKTPLRDPTGRVVGLVGILRDIQERKESEQALRESEERYRLLFEASPHSMWVFDTETLKFLAVNDAAVARYGYTRNEFLRMSITDIRPPMDVSTLAERLGEALPEMQPGMAWRHQWKDGTVRDVEVASHAISFGGRPGRLVLVTDVTERKRAEQGLAERARLASLVGDVGLALTRGGALKEVLGLCAEAIVRHLDAAFARIWTMNESEGLLELQASAGVYTHLDGPHGRVPVGRYKIGLIAQERRPHLTNAVIGDPLVGDQDWARREGMVAFAGFPLLLSDRRVGVVALFARHPLTETTLGSLAAIADQLALGIDRRRTEVALWESQKRLQHVVTSSPAILFTLAVADNQVRGISWISDNLRETFGYEPSDAYSPTWWLENIHLEDRDRVVAQTQNDLFSAGRTAHEYRFRHRDGAYRWTRGEIRLIRDAVGRSAEAVGSWSDVTERHVLEDKLRQSQKMDAFGQLAGGVAHDFNNLLTIINGYSDLLLHAPPLGVPSRDLISEIYKAGERAAALTRQLLAFSRQQVLAPRILDINTVVADTEKMLHRILGEDIQLTYVPAPSLWSVKVDPGQVEQVIMNLAVNARDAMPTGGRLTIETRNVELDDEYALTRTDVRAGQYILLSVADTGTGMSPEVVTRIFEPFFTTKGAGQGTGLGLATVFGIVKQSGGHVAVYSEVGVGTTFKVYLPRVDGATDTRASTRSGRKELPRGGETVLLVEDESGVRALTRRILVECGYAVLEAAEADQAVRAAAGCDGPIHLLVTDVVMPGASGRAVAERVTACHPGVRVLYVSGYTDDAVVRHGVLQDGVHFLQKPFTPDALAFKVREVLDQPA